MAALSPDSAVRRIKRNPAAAGSAIPSIIDAATDPALFGNHFRDLDSWGPWFTFNKALFGLPMDEADLELFRKCTGRQNAPTQRASAAYLIIGRRGGKSRNLALLAAYLATFIDWSPYLVAGETGHIVIVAADRRQCRVIKSYVAAFLRGSPLTASLIANETAEEILLTNGILIEIVTCSFRTIRGRTVLVGIGDEGAFWPSEDGSNPASAVLTALIPAMATVRGSLLLFASSPYRKEGPLWDARVRQYGKDGATLVWQAPTLTMNPSLPKRIVDEAYEADPVGAAVEYGAEFHNSIASFVDREAVEACVIRGRFELPPRKTIPYCCFVDAAGGSGSDAFPAAIAHREGERVVLDALRIFNPPFSPDAVVAAIAAFVKSYGLSSVTGDRYAGDWPGDRFRAHAIQYVQSERTKSQIYTEFLPLLNAGTCELLDSKKLVGQLCGLERRVGRGTNRDNIDHGPAGHDDVCNAAAGALVLAANDMNFLEIWKRCYSG